MLQALVGTEMESVSDGDGPAPNAVWTSQDEQAARTKDTQHLGDAAFGMRRVLDALRRDHASNDALRNGSAAASAANGRGAPLSARAPEQLDADVEAGDKRSSTFGLERKRTSAAANVEHTQSLQLAYRPINPSKTTSRRRSRS